MVTDTALLGTTNTKAVRMLKKKQNLHKGKGKGKFHRITGHKGPEGE